MTAIIKNQATWAALAYTFLYFFASFFIGAEQVRNVIDYGVLIVSGIFLASWLPTVIEAYKSGGIEKKYRLALGLALLAAGLMGQRAWIIIVNQVGIENWVSKDLVSGFVGSWLAAGILLCLSIDAKQEGMVPHLKFYYTGIVAGVCLVIGFIARGILFP
jgi:hypothetical protein